MTTLSALKTLAVITLSAVRPRLVIRVQMLNAMATTASTVMLAQRLAHLLRNLMMNALNIENVKVATTASPPKVVQVPARKSQQRWVTHAMQLLHSLLLAQMGLIALPYRTHAIL